MNTPRVAIVGCGNIGLLYDLDPKQTGVSTHMRAYSNRLPNSSIAVYDPNVDRLQLCADAYRGVKIYKDLDEMLTVFTPTIASVCTPETTHLELARKVVPRVPTVLFEKPLGCNFTEAKAIADLAQQSGSRLLVNYLRPFDPLHLHLAKQMKTGALGKHLDALVHFYGSVRNSASHFIDFFNQTIASATEVRVLDPAGRFEIYFGDLRVLFLSTPRGIDRIEVDVWGELGRVTLVNNGHESRIYKREESLLVSGYFDYAEVSQEGWDMSIDDAMQRAIDRTLAVSAATIDPNPGELESALKVQEVLDRVTQGRSGKL